MSPKRCGAAPGATTVLAFTPASGNAQPLAGAWQDTQPCLLPGVDRLVSKKRFLPKSSIGSSAMAPADQSTKGMAATDATIRDLAPNAAAARLGDMPRAKSAFDLLMMVSPRQTGSVRTSQTKAGADGLTDKMADRCQAFP